MIDFNNRYLIEIEKFLEDAIAQSEVLSADEMDPREITYEIVEQVKQNCFTYENLRCIPNIVTISIPENKGEKAEDFETIFNAHNFIELMDCLLADYQLRLFNPIHIEVQTVSKGNSRVMFGRAGLALDWPGPDMASECVRVELDYRTRKIVAVQPPHPQIPRLARLVSINAEVYQNQYLITKADVHVGRLRSVIDEESGKLIRRNDFVFAHQDAPDAVPNSVSRQHATIQYRDGCFYLIDQGSANGTSIKRGSLNQKINVKADNPVKLEDGDILRFGSAYVNFELLPPEAADTRLHYELPLPINPHPGLPKTTGQMGRVNLNAPEQDRFDTTPRRSNK
jgi:hypothetical protein